MISTYIDPAEALHVQMEAIAEDLHISGQTDGYLGIRPQHLDLTYLQGYTAGCQRKNRELQHQLDELSQLEVVLVDEF